MKFIPCGGCGTNNRVAGFKIAAIPKCGRCGKILPEPVQIRTMRVFIRHWAWFVLGGVLGLFFLVDALPVSNGEHSKQSIAICQAVPINAGIYKKYSNSQLVAPLRLVTPYGENYYIKLVEKYSKQTELTVFVYGGFPLEIDVPLGIYELRYAYGHTWCGEPILFGKDTQYGKAEADFSFQINDQQISGYTVELTPRVNGNLKTKAISGAAF